ncbi:hypothetical protein [Coralloluteibacterium stylophorae]|uniref:Secreted protein n=1 Tax=Coralloluteibacterium stylophorae TaxID=1776034 RepID=A0A8J7VTU0_9GAMM|nr:hypothetical protein [Coralloluteibacterium stylophorae]MBS7458208.1 hypothetical protein [Coralloluteibacterium stylophorae]
MNKLLLLLAIIAIPEALAADAGATHGERRCPDGAGSGQTVTEPAREPAHPAATPAARPAAVPGGDAVVPRSSPLRWHSVLPGMFR